MNTCTYTEAKLHRDKTKYKCTKCKHRFDSPTVSPIECPLLPKIDYEARKAEDEAYIVALVYDPTEVMLHEGNVIPRKANDGSDAVLVPLSSKFVERLLVEGTYDGSQDYQELIEQERIKSSWFDVFRGKTKVNLDVDPTQVNDAVMLLGMRHAVDMLGLENLGMQEAMKAVLAAFVRTVLSEDVYDSLLHSASYGLELWEQIGGDEPTIELMEGVIYEAVNSGDFFEGLYEDEEYDV